MEKVLQMISTTVLPSNSWGKCDLVNSWKLTVAISSVEKVLEMICITMLVSAGNGKN